MLYVHYTKYNQMCTEYCKTLLNEQAKKLSFFCFIVTKSCEDIKTSNVCQYFLTFPCSYAPTEDVHFSKRLTNI